VVVPSPMQLQVTPAWAVGIMWQNAALFSRTRVSFVTCHHASGRQAVSRTHEMHLDNKPGHNRFLQSRDAVMLLHLMLQA